jgi:hypothetical protein
MAHKISDKAHPALIKEAIQIESFFKSIGMSENDVFVSDIEKSNSFKLMAIIGEKGTSYYFDNGLISYLETNEGFRCSPLCIPVFHKEFGIDIKEVFNSNADISHVRDIIEAKSPKSHFSYSYSEDPNIDEGIMIVKQGADYVIKYTERGEIRVLAHTPYPWIAGMYLAWTDNFMNIDWFQFWPG